MKTKLTFLIIAAALAAATAGRAQTVISYSTDGGAQALETGSVRQTVLDTATLEVSYRMEWLRRPDSKEPMQDLLLLQAGGKVTKFFSYKTLQRDSLLRITPTEQVLANVGNFKGGLEAVVFQNYPAGELTCTDKISRDNMLYTEPLPEIEWTLRDGTRVDTEQESAASCRQQLSARIALKANTERFYMLEKLEASLAWNDLRAVLSGSYPNRQRAEAPAYGIENDLKYIRRTGTRSLTVTSYLKYLTRPQSLDVVRETGNQRQTIADRAFYMNHNAAFGTQAGRFAFAFKGGVSALFRGLVTDLTGTGLGTGTANDLSAGYAGVYLQPGITYRSQRLRLTLDLPAGYRRYGLHDRIDGSRTPAGIFTWKPRFAVKWSPTGHLSLSASGTVGRDAADDSRTGNGAVLRNYRSVLCGVNEYRQALQRSLSAGIAYKNPIGGFFASLLAVRSWNDLPFLPAQRFDGDYIVNYYVHSSNRVRSWYLSGDVSQNIDALNGQAGLNVGYNLSGTELLLEEVPTSYENSTLTVAPRFNFRFAAWVNTEYRLEYRYTTLSIRGREPDGRHDFNQRLTVNLVPSKKWVIQFTAEHYYSQLSADRSKHLLLADASLRWKINGKWEATATAANLFGREEYAYTTFDGVSSSSYRYAIRPRNILLGASWKF